ncbi:MAG: hypothetical protein Q7R49_01950 [Candidatus Daviesbacteria bacterium]|nr:hypothetical protein [Candidatus Daviesbacteria bacterium]
MILESLTSGEINIGNLNIDEPQRGQEMFFDPEKVITNEDWEFIKVALYNTVEVRNYLQRAAHLKILFPEREKDLKLEEENIWERTGNQIVSTIGSFKETSGNISKISLYHDAVGLMAADCILFPEKARQIKNLYSEIERLAVADGFFNRSLFPLPADQQDQLYANSAIVSRESLRLLRFNHQEDRKTIWEREIGLVGRLAPIEGNGRVEIFIGSSARFRLTFPDHPLKISQEMWVEMKKQLNILKPNTWLFVELACYMKILAAEELRITDQGIDFIKHPSFQVQSPKLPEMRKF